MVERNLIIILQPFQAQVRNNENECKKAGPEIEVKECVNERNTCWKERTDLIEKKVFPVSPIEKIYMYYLDMYGSIEIIYRRPTEKLVFFAKKNFPLGNDMQLRLLCVCFQMKLFTLL